MRYSPIWIAVAKASDEELRMFADDIWNNVQTIPFVGDLGTDNEDGAYTIEELCQFLREFAHQHMNSVGAE